MYVYINHAHLYNRSAPPCHLTTAVLNDCYSEVMAYTVLAYSYWASFYNSYECQSHTHQRYRLQLPNSCRTLLTNHIEPISCHITPLVINSLRGGHTQTRTHTDVRTKLILRNQARAGLWPAHAWFKNST